MTSKMNMREAPHDQYFFIDSLSGDIVFKNSSNPWVFGESSNVKSTLRFDKATADINSETTFVHGKAVFNSNVGVGTSNPTSPLDIRAEASEIPTSNALSIYNEGQTATSHSIVSLAVNGSNSGDPFVAFTNDASNAHNAQGWCVGMDNSDDTSFKIANSWADLASNTRITIDKSGKVGISTSNPTQTLDVNGTVNANAVLINNQPLSTDVGGGFRTIESNITYTISNVGIGLSNPTAPLQISASTSTLPHENGLIIYNSNSDPTSHAIAAVVVSGETSGDPLVSFSICNVAVGWSVGIDNSDNDSFKIANTWNDLESNTRITIDNTGKVGIGTSNPTEALEVNGSMLAREMKIGSSDFMLCNKQLLFQDSGAPTMSLSSNLLLVKNSKPFTVSNANFIVANCNVGIGTIEPAFKLDVDGVVNSTGLYVNGAPYIGSQWATEPNTSNSISITNSNVGIGTTTPTTTLHISGTTRTTALQIGTSNFELGSNTLTLGNSIPFTISNGHLVVANCNLGVGKSDPAFKIDVDGIVNSSAFYVNGAPYIGSQWITHPTTSSISIKGSNVGINTDAPATSLHVAGDVTFDSNIYIKNAVGMKGLRITTTNREENHVNLTSVMQPTGYEWNNGDITLSTSDSNHTVKFQHGSNETMRLANGMLGIGVSNPTYPLDVNGIVNATALYVNGTPYIGSQWITTPTTSNSIYITGCNVGIGTSNPNPLYSLDIGGSIGLSGDIMPATTQTQSIGASNNRFKEAWIETFAAPTSRITGDAEIAGQASISNNLTVKGDLIVQGAAVVLDIASLEVEDNMILLNRNQVGSGVTAGTAGIRIDRGDATDFVAIFDESDDLFKVGFLGAEKIVATRDWAAASNHDAAAITTGILPIARGGTGVEYSTGTGSNVLSHSPTLTGTVTASIINATTVTGNGAGISNIDAGNIASGILPTTRGGTGVIYSTGTGSNVLSHSPTLTGTLAASNITATNIYTTSNMGVGKNNPLYSLDVTGDINFTGTLRQNGTAFTSGTQSGFTLGSGITYTTCNVGIGLSAPSYALHVSGSIYATSDIIAFSDSRVKTDLLSITDSIAKLKVLTGYTYKMHGESNTNRHAGLIAQDVQKVLPEVVHENNEGYLGISYGNLAALFVEGFKEIDKRLARIEAHLNI